MPSYIEAFHRLRAALEPLYDAGEAAAIAKRYLAELTGFSYAAGLGRRDNALSDQHEQKLHQDLEHFRIGRPLQYILGFEEFLARRFIVNEAVLIPRPETEGLVQWVGSECGDVERLLDVGTGSGCIAVSLALAMQQTKMYAADISVAALAVARMNATVLDARVNFLEVDVLNASAWSVIPSVDVIVSNPPYIPAAERARLHQNVREWEPGEALFVPDDDPVIFYRALAALGKEKLSNSGRIYCELQSDRAIETQEVFETAGYHVALREDGFGHWRMLRASLV